MKKLALYQELHKSNLTYGGGGIGLLPVISELIEYLNAKSVLDYGCGKGGLVRALQEKFPDIKVCGYDPAVEEFENLPTEKFDLVVNTDVLEHIPADELPETVERIAGFSKNVFFHLHHAPASQILENGENAHCTIWSPQQYNELFSKFFPGTVFLPGASEVNTACITFQLPQDLLNKCAKLIQGFEINYFKDLQQIIQSLHSYKEVVVFPFADEGIQFLEYLKYANLSERVCCTATPKDDFDNTVQAFYESIPQLPFEMLVHFRESALFIVAAPAQYHQSIGYLFRDFGAKLVVYINAETQKQIQSELQKMLNSGVAMARFMYNVDKKLNDIYRRIEYQDEIRRVNTQAFEEFRNAFRGRKVVITATGPTLKYYKPIPDAIHIGLNWVWRNENVALDYLFTGDRNTNLHSVDTKIQDGFDRIKQKIFICRHFTENGHICLDFGEDISCMDKVRRFYCGFAFDDIYIPHDITVHPLWGMATIAELAIHFALFTYPKELYLVGCDVSTDGYFYKFSTAIQELAQKNTATHRMKVAYARFKMFARQYYPDTEIISINPVGLKGLFKDIYTDEYKNNFTRR